MTPAQATQSSTSGGTDFGIIVMLIVFAVFAWLLLTLHRAAATVPEPELVPVQIVADLPERPLESQPFEIWLANGVALNIAAGFDEHELRRLVDVLSAC